MIYPPYTLLRLAIRGRGFCAPDFERIAQKFKEKRAIIYYEGAQCETTYYFMLFWTVIEVGLIVVFVNR